MLWVGEPDFLDSLLNHAMVRGPKGVVLKANDGTQLSSKRELVLVYWTLERSVSALVTPPPDI